MERTFLWIAVTVCAVAILYLAGKNRDLEYDIKSALSSVARMSKALAESIKELDAVRSQLDEAMAEIKKQGEREAQWNEGLNNILNYSLEQAFEAGVGLNQ